MYQMGKSELQILRNHRAILKEWSKLELKKTSRLIWPERRTLAHERPAGLAQPDTRRRRARLPKRDAATIRCGTAGDAPARQRCHRTRRLAGGVRRRAGTDRGRRRRTGGVRREETESERGDDEWRWKRTENLFLLLFLYIFLNGIRFEKIRV
jgi:hypothetical protein